MGLAAGLNVEGSVENWRVQAEPLKDGVTEEEAGLGQEQVWGAGPVWAAHQTCSWGTPEGTWITDLELSAGNIN